MNFKCILFSALVSGSLLALGAHAATPLSTTEAEALWSQLPKPIKVVKFHGLPQRFDDSVVHVILTVDETGTPQDVQGWKPLPADLAARVLPAVQQWRFEPAQDKSGKPVPLRIVLPLRLIAAR